MRVELDPLRLPLGDGGQLEVRRVRDPRARRIRLVVDERGARLTLPARASLVAGERFVIANREWLLRQIERHALPAADALEPFVTEALPLRGARVPLRWSRERHASLGPDPQAGGGTALLFTLPPRGGTPAAVRALREFYEAQARADVARWLPRYLDGLPRTPRRFRIRPVRSQWGSLAPDATVSLDLALVLARPPAFEYVLVHELCHLIHANHSAAFWAEVEARCPHWRAERDWLRAHGGGIKAQLRGLLDAGGPGCAPLTRATGVDTPTAT